VQGFRGLLTGHVMPAQPQSLSPHLDAATPETCNGNNRHFSSVLEAIIPFHELTLSVARGT
jgi:hypothetical protein